MSLQFPDDFDAVFARHLGVSRGDVLSAVEAPDGFRVLMRAECSLALKRTPARPYEYLLVLVERGQPAKLMAAWPLPFGLVEPGTDPLQALEALCARYGSRLLVPGAEPGTLVRDVTFQGIPGRTDEIYQLAAEGLRGRVDKQITQMRVTMDPPRDRMHLSLLYSIDPDVVARAVRQARPAR